MKKKQRYPRGTRVFISRNLPSSMSHFPKGIEAIVQYTYDQEFGDGKLEEGEEHKYSLILLNSDGEPEDSVSWYEESQLTLLDGMKEEGLLLIEEYNYAEYEA